jgi:hypothetical protein
LSFTCTFHAACRKAANRTRMKTVVLKGVPGLFPVG